MQENSQQQKTDQIKILRLYKKNQFGYTHKNLGAVLIKYTLKEQKGQHTVYDHNYHLYRQVFRSQWF
jgi:hypothetical protein